MNDEAFVYTTAIRKLRKLKKRIKIIPGGTSAGKTFGIIPILIDKAARIPGLEISVVSESIPHLRRGALKDFEKIMRSTNRWIEGNFSKSLLKYTFVNGSYIEFFGTDQPDKLRGARRSILYINEANNIHFEAYQQLSIRTSQEVWLDFNPTNEFWVHTELQDDPDAETLILTYHDNEALSENIIKEIEKGKKKAYNDPNLYQPLLDAENNIKSHYWHNWWKVYGLGLQGSLEGVIFSNWKQIESLPMPAKLIGSGLDFGYTNDPTAIIDVYVYNGQRILDERVYQTGLLNSQIADRIDKQTVWAESAEPKSIDEIKLRGKDIRPVVKGKDSVNYGIQIMQGQNYLVTARSVNLIKELRNYTWDTDKTGNKLNKPIDAWNHAIDAVRYHEMMTLGDNTPEFFSF